MARVERERRDQPTIPARLEQGSKAREAAYIKATCTRRGISPGDIPLDESFLEKAVRNPWIRFFFLFSTGVPTSSLLAACASSPPAVIQESPIPEISPTSEMPHVVYIPFVEKGDTTPTLTPTFTPIPPPTETPKPTATATNIPEVKKDVPCTILPDQYCSKAVRLEWISDFGEPLTLIGFNLPPGTPIFAPRDGQVAKGVYKQPSAWQGSYATIINPQNANDVRFEFDGDIEISITPPSNVKKSASIGKTKNTGVTNFGYNLVVYAAKYDSGNKKWVSDDDFLKELFPAAFTKPASRVSLPLVVGTPTTSYDTFYLQKQP